MKYLKEEDALAIIYANTKRKKRKDNLISVAKAFEFLVKLYGSKEIVARKVGLSSEMVREFLLILKLPLEVQKMVYDRKIDSLDILREISAIRDPALQREASYKFLNTPSKDVRDIKRLVKQARLTLDKAKKTIIDARPKGLNIFIIDLDDETYSRLIKKAKVKKLKPADLVKNIISDWLKKHEGKET